QKLVERQVELRARVEEGLERQAATPALGLRDGAGGDAEEPRELRLAEVALRAHRAQRGAEARRRRRGLQRRAPVLDAAAEDTALDTRPARLGLRDPQAPLAQGQDALGDLVDLAAQRRQRGPVADRPVRDRAGLEQVRAAAHEERA